MTTIPPPAQPPLEARAVEALLLDTTPWLSCKDCFARMDTHVEALLRSETTRAQLVTPTDAATSHVDPAMDRHLQGCVACDEEAQSLLVLLRSESA